jgi:FG-GAP repeat
MARPNLWTNNYGDIAMIRPSLFTLILITSMTVTNAFGGSVSRLAELTASDAQQGYDDLGVAVAMSGDTVVVGDSGAGGMYNTNKGAAYVFVKPASGWQNMTQTAKLTASDGAKLDGFGASVAIRGDIIVVGAPNRGIFYEHKNFGSVYVFVKPAGGWADMTETAELTSSGDNSVAGFVLGMSVAIDGAGITVFGGAPGAGSNGEVLAFVKPNGGWQSETQSAELTSADGASIGLGGTLSASGNTVVSGAPAWPNSESNDCCLGAAYLWTESVSGWTNMTETARFTSYDSQGNDLLGAAVSLDGSTLVAGAPGVTINGNYQQGAAYVFLEPSGGWQTTTQFKAKLTAFDGAGKDGLGAAVAVEDGVVVLGAPGNDEFEGATCLYLEPESGWASTAQYNLTISDPASQADAFFGASISLQHGLGVIGAYLEKPTGAAYVFGAKR